MTKDEFEKEARRVLETFNFDVEMPMDIVHSLRNHYRSQLPFDNGPREGFHFNLKKELYELQIVRFWDEVRDTFVIQIQEATGFTRFTGYLKPVTGQSLERSRGQSHKHSHLIVRPLFRLGYDIERLCAESLLPTAHEKLQWYLEDKEKFALESEGEAR